ncbi:MAG: hypothetical protein AAF611_13700 [Bacteroidota bacterium]
MSEWKLITQIKKGAETDAYTFFQIEHVKEADDIIEAAFTKWNGKYAREIQITYSSYPRIFRKVNYCPDKDAIEIHCEVDEKLKASTYLKTPIHCSVDCIKVELIEHEVGVPIETCSPDSSSHPDSKKGAIIVGI